MPRFLVEHDDPRRDGNGWLAESRTSSATVLVGGICSQRRVRKLKQVNHDAARYVFVDESGVGCRLGS